MFTKLISFLTAFLFTISVEAAYFPDLSYITSRDDAAKKLNGASRQLYQFKYFNDVYSGYELLIDGVLNASQSIEENGVIEIRTYTNNGQVCVDIKDTGRGIEKEYLPKVFDIFFSEKIFGTSISLGLSVSRNIVKEYGGEIQVQSENGKGSTFTVFLPHGLKQSAH